MSQMWKLRHGTAWLRLMCKLAQEEVMGGALTLQLVHPE